MTALRRGLLILLTLLLGGCVTSVWTGASLIYDRHNIYLKLNDFQLGTNICHSLYRDKLLKCPGCAIELAIFNRDVLMVGRVPTEDLRQEASLRVKSVPGKRRFFNQLSISNIQLDPLLDSWITTKIRTDILADSTIDPHQFKIVTSNQIVYIMGDVLPDQAQKVIDYARQCESVRRVVTLLRYYNVSDKPLKMERPERIRPFDDASKNQESG